MSWRRLALLLAVLLLVGAPAGAHGGGLFAVVSVEPPAPAPGQRVQLTVQILDAYNNPVPGAEVVAGATPLAALQDGGPHQGQVEMRPGESDLLRLQVRAASSQWRAEVPLQDPGGQVTVPLVHVEQGISLGLLIFVGLAGAMLLAGLIVFIRSSRE